MASWTVPCSSSSLSISSASSDRAEPGVDRVEPIEQRPGRGDRLFNIAQHVRRRIERRLLRDKPDRGARRGRAVPIKSVSTPAMIRSSVLFPAPLPPSTPIFAPG